jgi:hypothetical protein
MLYGAKSRRNLAASSSSTSQLGGSTTAKAPTAAAGEPVNILLSKSLIAKSPPSFQTALQNACESHRKCECVQDLHSRNFSLEMDVKRASKHPFPHHIVGIFLQAPATMRMHDQTFCMLTTRIFASNFTCMHVALTCQASLPGGLCGPIAWVVEGDSKSAQIVWWKYRLDKGFGNAAATGEVHNIPDFVCTT